MEYRVLRLAHKRCEIQIEGLVQYDIYSEVPDIVKITKEFKVIKGEKAFDFIGLCDPWNIAISENVKNLLESNGITGWKAYPIDVIGVDVKYFLFEITGKAGMKCEYDSDGDFVHGTLAVEEETWDGSDIFYVGNTGHIICTEKIRTLLESKKITNVIFDGLETC